MSRPILLPASALSRRRLLASFGVAITAAAVTTSHGRGQGTGELVIGAPQDRHSVDPPLPNVGMSIPNPNVFETLVTLGPDFQPQPGLAESWEFVEPNTWRFTLRQGVTFHDGTPFTAEAVQWTMARVAASGGGVLGIGENSVTIVDDFTVEITPTSENRRLPLQLSAPRTGSIIAPNTDVVNERIGTGPFREVEYVREEHYTVEAYNGYWADPAQLSRITFRFMPDPTTRMLALQAGEVDLIYDVPREATVEITSNDSLQLVTSGVGAYQALYFNIHGTEPYDLGQDPVVRKAVAHAIDKAIIVESAWEGAAEVNNTMVPPAVLGESAATVTGVPFDPAQAKAMLDEAGWIAGDGGVREKDGRPLKLTMVVGYPSAEIHGTMPEFVQAQLNDVGIEMEIVQTPDIGNFEERLISGEGDLWAEVGNQVDADPCYLPGLLFYSPQPDLDPALNSYANAFAPGAEFDALIDGCGAVAAPAEIQSAAAAALKLLIDEQQVVIPIAGVLRLYGATDRVEGFEAHPVQFLQRWDAVSVTTD